MDILNDLSKKLTSMAQSTVQASKDLAENAKVALAVSAEEREIEKAYRALGQWYYATRGQETEEAQEFIDIVETSLRKIRVIREESEAARAAANQPTPLIACPACGAEIEQDTKFCPACGAMQPTLDIIAREDAVCPQCGGLTTGPYCPQCGNRVQE